MREVQDRRRCDRETSAAVQKVPNYLTIFKRVPIASVLLCS